MLYIQSMPPHRKLAKLLTYEKSGVANNDVTAALRQKEDQQRGLVCRTFPGVKFAPTDAELIEKYLIPNIIARGVRPVHFRPFFHNIKLDLHSPVELFRMCIYFYFLLYTYTLWTILLMHACLSSYLVTRFAC